MSLKRLIVWFLVGLALSFAWLVFAHLAGIGEWDRAWVCGAISGTTSIFGVSNRGASSADAQAPQPFREAE